MKTNKEAVELAAKFHAKRMKIKDYIIIGENMHWEGNIYDVFADKFIQKGDGEMLYQIFDVTEKMVIENSVTFDGAKTFVAGHWDILEDEEQYNKIMAANSVDQLNNYAEGLDFIIEEQGVDFE